jgi:single-stranded DNA-binding protein
MGLQVNLDGNLGKEVFYRAGDGEKQSFAALDVAETHPIKQEDGSYEQSEANWVNVKLFGETADQAAELNKGDRIHVNGFTDVETYQNSAGETVAKEVVNATSFEKGLQPFELIKNLFYF